MVSAEISCLSDDEPTEGRASHVKSEVKTEVKTEAETTVKTEVKTEVKAEQISNFDAAGVRQQIAKLVLRRCKCKGFRTAGKGGPCLRQFAGQIDDMFAIRKKLALLHKQDADNEAWLPQPRFQFVSIIPLECAIEIYPKRLIT